MSYTFSIKKDSLGPILEVKVKEKILERDPLIHCYVERYFERVFQLIKPIIVAKKEEEEVDTEEEIKEEEVDTEEESKEAEVEDSKSDEKSFSLSLIKSIFPLSKESGKIIFSRNGIYFSNK